MGGIIGLVLCESEKGMYKKGKVCMRKGMWQLHRHPPTGGKKKIKKKKVNNNEFYKSLKNVLFWYTVRKKKKKIAASYCWWWWEKKRETDIGENQCCEREKTRGKRREAPGKKKGRYISLGGCVLSESYFMCVRPIGSFVVDRSA